MCLIFTPAVTGMPAPGADVVQPPFVTRTAIAPPYYVLAHSERDHILIQVRDELCKFFLMLPWKCGPSALRLSCTQCPRA
jgi:hypothetical protein